MSWVSIAYDKWKGIPRKGNCVHKGYRYGKMRLFSVNDEKLGLPEEWVLCRGYGA